MASYPGTPKAYPGTPKAYPGTPKAYPGASIKTYPLGTLTADFSQTSTVDISATALGVADFSQTSNVEAVVALSTLVPAQLDIEPGNAIITLGTTMRSSGTTPPIVLLAAGTGSLTFGAGLCPGFWVDILPGALTFDLSFNSGSTVSFAAQTIPVGGGNYTIPSGTYAGMIVTFPLGTYNADNLYEGTVGTLKSSEGSSYTFAQGTAASQPVLRKAVVTPDGKDALFHATVARSLISTDAAVAALFANDPALTVFGRIAYTVVDALGCWLSAANSGANDSKQRYFRQANTGQGRENHVVINDAVTTTSNVCTTDPLTAGTAAHTVCWFFPGSNGGANIEVNGAAEALTIATLNPGTVTPNQVGIGTVVDSAPTTPMAGYIYRIVCFSSALSPADRAAWVTEIAT